MKRFVPYLKKYGLFYIVGILATFVALGLDAINPRLQMRIIDDVIVGGKMNLLGRTLLALLVISVSRGIFGYIREIMFDTGSVSTVANLRKDLFDHIQKLSFSFFDRTNTGELMSRIKEDADNVWNVMAFGMMLLIENITGFVVASIMIFTLNWKLALISLVTIPFIGWVAVRLEKQIGAAYGKLSDQGVVLNTTAQENIAGVRLVKAFAREKYEIRKFLKHNKRNYRLNLEMAGIWSKHYPMIELLSNITVIIVVAVGGMFVIGEKMTIGTLVAFSGYIQMLIWPMRMIGWLTNLVARCNASLKKIEKIFNELPEVKEPENPIAPEKFEGHVILRDVSLKFGETEVLKNINIDARPGSTVAIMGMTGSGKSSIINLIGRYYDCTSGDILIDGVSVRDMKLKTLREQVSVVMQDTFLFSDTVEENVRFGAQQADREDMLAASRDARVNDFAMQLKEGYDTVVGERGIGLSGGQKQRITIARALLKQASILVLDDATSAMDLETEYEIQKALEQRKGMTKFIIAHRISAVKNADEILIIENGEIVERGTHSQLMKLKGRYYETCNEQFQGISDILDEEVV